MNDTWYSKAKATWDQKKQEYKGCSVASPIVTSFTDRQPLHGWVKADSIRELWQNFKDGLTSSFEGVKIDYTVQNDFVFARAGGLDLGTVDLCDRDKIIFSQKFCWLTERHLQLASFKSNESIGGHGEGFKVAINLLLRYNVAVTYYMAFKTWRFSLKGVYGTDLQNMVIDVEKTEQELDEMVIEICGRNIKTSFEMSMDIDLLEGFKCVANSQTGSLYVCPLPYHGNAYCRNLFVTRDNDFQIFQLAINLNMQVARDRHILHTPLVPKLVSILKAFLSCVSDKSSSSDTVFEHLLNVTKALSYNLSDKSLVVPMKKYISIKKNCSVDDVLFISEHFSEQVDALAILAKVPIINDGLADVLDFDKYVEELIIKLPDCKDQLTGNEKESVEYFMKFLKTIELTLGFHVDVLVKESDRKLSGSSVVFQYNPRCVHVLRFMISTVSTLAINTVTKIGRFNWSRDQDFFLSEALRDFLKFEDDPASYLPRKYDVLTKQQRNSQQSGPSNHSSAIPNHSNYQTENNKGIPKSMDNTKFGKPEEILKKIRKKVSTVDLGQSLNVNALNDTTPNNQEYISCSFSGTILKTEVAGFPFPIFSEQSYIRKLTTDAIFSKEVLNCLRNSKNQLALISSQLIKKKMLSETELAYQFVLITPQVLGYTNDTNMIFINITPLLSYDSNQLKKSLVLTVVHELTHRSSKSHNSQFASEASYLLYALME